MTATQKVHGLASLESLRQRWDALYAEADSRNPFLSFVWTASWLRRFAPTYERALVVELESTGRHRGIAPLILRRWHRSGLTLRTIEFAGGDDIAYKGPIVSGDRDAFADDLLRYLTRVERGWDLCMLDSLPADEAWAQRLSRATERHAVRIEAQPTHDARFLRLPRDVGTLRQGYKKSLRHNLARRQRRAAEQGIVVERHSGAALTPELLREARDIEHRSWKHRDGVGIFGDDRHFGLHLDVLADRDRPFEPDLVMLRARDGAIAFQYGFVQRECYFAYNTSYDPAHRELAPGPIMIDALLESLIADGATMCDFLIGDHEYKRDWAPGVRPNEGVTIFGGSARGRLAFHGQRVRRALAAHRARRAASPTSGTPDSS